jgi:hypothetical protein
MCCWVVAWWCVNDLRTSLNPPAVGFAGRRCPSRQCIHVPMWGGGQGPRLCGDLSDRRAELYSEAAEGTIAQYERGCNPGQCRQTCASPASLAAVATPQCTSMLPPLTGVDREVLLMAAALSAPLLLSSSATLLNPCPDNRQGKSVCEGGVMHWLLKMIHTIGTLVG